MSSKKELRTALRVIEAIRDVSPDLPIQTASTFMTIALSDGILMKDLAESVGISQSSVSRNVMALGAKHRKGYRGLDLVVSKEDPQDWRMKRVWLTPSGKRLANKIAEVLT